MLIKNLAFELDAFSTKCKSGSAHFKNEKLNPITKTEDRSIKGNDSFKLQPDAKI
ncbi:hypothetical protein D9M68_873360 [compost metagenome]